MNATTKIHVAARRGLSRSTLAAVALALVLAAPLFFVATSFFTTDGGAWAHLRATVLPELIRSSLLLAVAVAIGVSVIGTLTAWLTAHHDFPGRAAFEWLLILPLAMPAYVMGYAYTDALQYAGPVQTGLRAAFGWQSRADYWFFEVQSLSGAATMLMFVLYPYVFMLARAAFLAQSASLIEAGRTFGYGGVALFFRVSLPLARPAIAAGTALALMETLADYGTVSYFGVSTFTTGIFNAWFSMGDRVSAARLAVLLMTAVIVVVLIERWARRRAQYQQSGQRHAARPRARLRGTRAGLAVVACSVPLLVGFVIPLLLLAKLALTNLDINFAAAARFAGLAGNSFVLAAFTALVAVALALVLAYAARAARSSLPQLVNRIVGLGYAVPGMVVAVGALIPIAILDHALANAIQSLTGTPTGLLLTGGVGVLIYAYLVRFLSVALQSVEAGLSSITVSMDDAARSLGSRTSSMLARVHLPLLRTSLLTAGLLVFVDVMKELPATLVMRPFNFNTLAVEAYVLAKDERLAEAAVASLAIVLVGLVPVILASRAMTGAMKSPQSAPPLC